MKQENRSTRKEAAKPARRIDLSACKLVGPYGRDLHERDVLNSLPTKVGKPGMRSVTKK